MSEAVATLVAAIVGGILATGGLYVVELVRESQRRRNLCASLAAELRAILAIVNDLNYLPMLEHTIASIKEHHTPMFFTAIVGEMHGRIFFGNAGNLGLLDQRLAEDLIAVHYEIGGVALDITNLAKLAENAEISPSFQLIDWPRSLQLHERLLERSRNTRDRASDLINRLEGVQ